MKKSIQFIAVLLAFIFTSCGKNEFSIEFNLKSDVNENYRMVYYAADKKKGWLADMFAPVTAGKASLKGLTRLPAIVYICDKGNAPVTAFYVERGDKIKISGDADPLSWKITGNKINEQWSEWRIANRDKLKNPGLVNKVVEEYVNTHKDSPLSTLLLMTTFNQNQNPVLFEKLWNSLSEKSRDEKWLRLFNRHDLPGNALSIPGVTNTGFKGMVNPDSVIEVRYADARRNMFWFRDGSNPPSVYDIKGLRDALKDRKDVRFRVVLCTADTASLRYDHTVDSIPGSGLLWAPEGTASRAAAAMNVVSIPAFVVTDSKGKVLYNGPDIYKAISSLK
ncbi:MAG: DUF4369 domain-containing protein [Prevotella sp.]|nr:DUF4369 domain-containing protein [Bacteroides sp.]MCM1366265.1 DUF4369 domain-containing protein [Prevotella sp.]MCM1436331.1 DUF4369 domain-containing protein [Prevotella sp.]